MGNLARLEMLDLEENQLSACVPSSLMRQLSSNAANERGSYRVKVTEQ